MLCEECGINQAEVIVTTVINGESITRHLCRSCLKNYQSGNLQTLLAAILTAMGSKNAQQEHGLACPRCGTTYAEFQKTGMLGCAECYQAFRPQLTPMITKLQGRSQHAGRRPPVNEEEQARMDRMEELRARMEAAVAVENFEEAAKLRDELRAMTPAKEEKS